MRCLRFLLILVALSTIFLTTCTNEEDTVQGGKLLKPEEASDVFLFKVLKDRYSNSNRRSVL